MKVIFWGTPLFAAEILKALLEDPVVEVLAIVTQPDRAQGRSAKLVPSAVKEMAQKHAVGVPILQPASTKEASFLAKLTTYDVDFFVVVAYGAILQKALLALPRILPINVHASLLPKYRGAAPIQRAIMEGERETGITIMEMVSKMDAGDMLAQGSVSIEDESTFMDVHDSLLKVATPLLLSALKEWYAGGGRKVAQQEDLVTYAEKILPKDRRIDWSQSVQRVHNQIRALSPIPGAFSFVSWGEGQKRQLMIRKATVYSCTSLGEVGQVVTSPPELLWGVCCGEGVLQLQEVQLEGKQRMLVQDFLRGSVRPVEMLM